MILTRWRLLPATRNATRSLQRRDLFRVVDWQEALLDFARVA